jgi:hypothetical protein
MNPRVGGKYKSGLVILKRKSGLIGLLLGQGMLEAVGRLGRQTQLVQKLGLDQLVEPPL